MLDIKTFIRKLPQPSQGHYYERREAYLTPRFTPARVYTRASHHLPGTEHGDEPPCTWVRRLRSDCNGSREGTRVTSDHINSDDPLSGRPSF